MSIPTLSVPEYDVKLYSLKQPVKFRPYLVGEEKLLLMAQQSEDPKEIRDTVKRVLSTCTFNKVNIDKLPSFDLEYLYLMLRAKSVNNIVTVNYLCRNEVTKNNTAQECGTAVPVSLNLDLIQLTQDPEHTNTIWLNETVGVTLGYPSRDRLQDITSDNGVFGVDLLKACIETIFTKDGTVYEIDNIDAKELQIFIESLSLPQFQLVQKFFDTMPKLTYDIDFKCPTCLYEQKIHLSGLMDFFV